MDSRAAPGAPLPRARIETESARFPVVAFGFGEVGAFYVFESEKIFR